MVRVNSLKLFPKTKVLDHLLTTFGARNSRLGMFAATAAALPKTKMFAISLQFVATLHLYRFLACQQKAT